MNFENVTTSAEETYLIRPKNITYSYRFKISGDSTNCKLSYIHGIGNLQGCTVQERKQIMEFLLSKCKGCVILNTIDKEVAEWITKNYPTYYHNQPQIGYHGGVQHHICIKNVVNINANCKNPPALNKDGFKLDEIKQKLTTILKQKRRKADYVDDFIKSL